MVRKACIWRVASVSKRSRRSNRRWMKPTRGILSGCAVVANRRQQTQSLGRRARRFIALLRKTSWQTWTISCARPAPYLAALTFKRRPLLSGRATIGAIGPTSMWGMILAAIVSALPTLRCTISSSTGPSGQTSITEHNDRFKRP